MKKQGSAFDPRTRLAIVVCLSGMSIVFSSLWWMSGLFLFTLLTAVFFGGKFWVLLRRFVWVFYMFVALLLLQSIFNGGEPVYLALGTVKLITAPGLASALLFALRIVIIVLSASILLQESSRRMTQALVQLRVPYELAFMTSVALRFVKILMEEMGNSLIAIQLRGVNLKKIPLRKRMSVYTYLFLPVLSGAIFKARQLSLSLELRGFKLHDSRTSYFSLCLQRADWLVIACMFLLTAAALIVYFAEIIAPV